MLDSITLVITLSISFSLQAILLLLMTYFVKAYQGMRFWAFGCTALALHFILIYLRHIGFNLEFSILASNFLSIFSLLCFLFGSKQMMGTPYRMKSGVWGIAVFMLAIAYFTFIDNQLNARIILYSFMTAIILFMNSFVMFKYNQDPFRFSASILASLFFIIGVYFIFRIIHTIIFPVTSNDFFTNDGIQPLTLLFGLCLGILWTQGVILLVNQKLNGSLTTKTEELEAINSEKDKLFSILAHDLRGPLTTIMGMVDLMADKKGALDVQTMQGMAEGMQKSIHSTNTLMDNLLDWALLQRGLNDIQKIQTTYGELMGTVMPTLLIQSANKKITLMDDIPAATPLSADTRMVQSIFRNLITNAIKFTPSKGSVHLTSNISNDGRLVFTVSDNGIGMEKELLDKLFQINPSGRRLGTEGENSTGLGLMICKEFVEKHGGQIWVESEIGKGSSFSFSLESAD
ncbi:MAG TPA: HAMP domain-containing sensor histidine kinase [Bacteroidales bacterium]|nr:HAMP domain-containing sensor histidine kinase [Bacteroidales bacterium]